MATRPVKNNGLGLTPAAADLLISKVEGFVFRLPDLDDTYRTWRDLVRAYQVSGKNAHDTRLVACMQLNRVMHILTFNIDDFKRFHDITIVTPS